MRSNIVQMINSVNKTVERVNSSRDSKLNRSKVIDNASSKNSNSKHNFVLGIKPRASKLQQSSPSSGQASVKANTTRTKFKNSLVEPIVTIKYGGKHKHKKNVKSSNVEQVNKNPKSIFDVKPAPFQSPSK